MSAFLGKKYFQISPSLSQWMGGQRTLTEVSECSLGWDSKDGWPWQLISWWSDLRLLRTMPKKSSLLKFWRQIFNWNFYRDQSQKTGKADLSRSALKQIITEDFAFIRNWFINWLKIQTKQISLAVYPAAAARLIKSCRVNWNVHKEVQKQGEWSYNKVNW